MKISPARSAAFEILTKIETEKSFSSILLPFYEQNLAAKDRSLCHSLTLGVLRRQIYLDRVIEKLTGGKKLDFEVRIALRIGLYQILFLDKIPAYSAINESVNLVQKAKKTSAKGLVNAVLRRAQKEPDFDFDYADEIERIAVETSHPRWLLNKWIAQFGAEETQKLAAANNRIPQSAFRLTNRFFGADAQTQSDILSAIESSAELRESENVIGSFVAGRINGEMLELAASGEIYFQDEASQMVAQAIEISDGEMFLDVCAAPGSKTTFIAGRTAHSQNNNLLVAGDLHPNRIRILRDNCRRQNADFVNIVRYDAEKNLPFAEESFDAVLVDAPCSGTGTIRHNPEIRYFLEEKDFAALPGKQLAILKNASKLIKSGGRLIYSTCSLETEENEAVCARFLAEAENFELAKPKISAKFKTSEGFARTFPQRDEMDGFFIAAFAKR